MGVLLTVRDRRIERDGVGGSPAAVRDRTSEHRPAGVFFVPLPTGIVGEITVAGFRIEMWVLMRPIEHRPKAECAVEDARDRRELIRVADVGVPLGVVDHSPLRSAVKDGTVGQIHESVTGLRGPVSMPGPVRRLVAFPFVDEDRVLGDFTEVRVAHRA